MFKLALLDAQGTVLRSWNVVYKSTLVEADADVDFYSNIDQRLLCQAIEYELKKYAEK